MIFNHLARNKLLYISLLAYISTVIAFSMYSLAFGEEGLHPFILDTRGYVSGDQVYLLLNELGADGVQYYLNMYLYGLDFIYPLAFCVFSSLFLVKNINLKGVFKCLYFFPLALFLSDCLENILIANILLNYPDTSQVSNYVGYAISIKLALSWSVRMMLIISVFCGFATMFNSAPSRGRCNTLHKPINRCFKVQGFSWASVKKISHFI